MRSYRLDPRVEAWLVKTLGQLGFPTDQPKRLAEAIQRLSDHFVNQAGVTPWQVAEVQAAYLAYFFPLGYVRGKAVSEELDRLRGSVGFENVFELGSGPGNVSVALLESFRNPLLKWEVQELSGEAFSLHRQLFEEVHQDTKLTRVQRPVRPGYDLGVFSYVLNELKEPPKFEPFETVVILEPSTRNHFDSFLGYRDRLQTLGYQILAPCPHQFSCPLAQTKDWCHDRVGFEAPTWFQDMERYLPMKNRTVTFSYLIASKKIHPTSGQARLTGDLLVEKGKSRIMICRGPKREFLSWLHRDLPDRELWRGDLLELHEAFEEKGNEIRLTKKS